MHGAGCFGIQRKFELFFPIELVAGIAQGVVAVADSGAVPGYVGGVGCDFVGDDSVFYVFFVGQAEVFFGRDVAEHRRAVPADHGRAYGGGDVVVAGGDVGDQRAQRVERGLVAEFVFFLDLLFDLVQRNVAGAFDHGLDVVLPGDLGQLARVASSANCASSLASARQPGRRPSPREKLTSYFFDDFADVVEALVQEILFVVVGHPLGEDRAAAADDSGDALGDHRQILNEHPGMDGHVVDALLGLLFDYFEHDGGVEVFDALDARDGFIDRHGADGNGGVAEDGFANFVNAAAGGEIHHGVGAIVNGGVQLFQFLFHIGGDGRVADIGVDFAERGDADGHRLEFGMVDVGGDDHASAGDFIAHKLGGDFLADGNVFHFLGGDALAGIVHLREVAVFIGRFAFGQPFSAWLGRSVEAVAIIVTVRGIAVRRRHFAFYHPLQRLTCDYTPQTQGCGRMSDHLVVAQFENALPGRLKPQ